MKDSETLIISLIGDIFPGELPYTLDYGIRTQFRQHIGKPWETRIKNILGDNDLVIGNLESPLLESSKALKQSFYGDPQFSEFLKNCGINVLNVANNHILEQGEDGFYNTIRILENTGLSVVGHIVNSKPKIVYQTIKGVLIAIAGFSDVDLYKIENNECFAELHEETVLSILKEMNHNKADIKILTFHWGNEYVNFPSFEQRRMAYKFIDAGASIIVGHHPHVIQPFEKYKSGHIFYSLGNFMFDFLQSKKVSQGLIAQIQIFNKEIFKINTRYVNLSFDELITLEDDSNALRKFSQIVNRYEKLKCLNKQSYEKIYKSQLSRKHFIERILMKTSIFNEFVRIPFTSKFILLKNILKYHLKLTK